ncbi:MAG: MBL fold metallo-hydrolase [Pseudomonadota bacterium]
MKLTILGSGSPEAYARRASSGYLIEAGNDVILFDCGGGVFDNLLRSGRKPSDITHLFFSHLHSDHMMDYARLVHAAWEEGGAPIEIFGPTPLAQITEGYFGAAGVLAHDLRARTEFQPSQEVWKARGGTLPRPWPEPHVHEIGPDFTFDGNGWSLATCPVPHAQPHLECFGFRLESGGRSFVYSGDAGICDPLKALSQNADLLLHWCYRHDDEPASEAMAPLTPTPKEISEMAKAAGVKQLVLSHFRIHMDAPELYAKALADLQTTFGERGAIAEDLDQFNV